MKLTLLFAFIATLFATSIHTHEDSHDTSSFHEICLICTHTNQVSDLDTPKPKSIIIEKQFIFYSSEISILFISELYSIDLFSISSRGPPSLLLS